MGFSVAIDGPAGAGKSTLAKAAAGELNFIYIDTGALYRTIALYLLRQGIEPSDDERVCAALPNITVELKPNAEGQRMFLCGEDVTGLIRTPQVSQAASKCSAIPGVRAFLLELQRELARTNDVLMDGRDIGTVVLPNADVKIFLTASRAVRAKRRLLQLEESGQSADYEKILAEIEERDYRDSHRETAPLKQAEDAELLDTSEMSFDESLEALLKIIAAKAQNRRKK